MSDNCVNSRTTNVLSTITELKVEKWSSVEVGDIICLNNNDQVPVSCTIFFMN